MGGFSIDVEVFRAQLRPRRSRQKPRPANCRLLQSEEKVIIIAQGVPRISDADDG
jgi:hypothetical protein